MSPHRFAINRFTLTLCILALSACSSSSGGGSTCDVTAVGVTANPTTVPPSGPSHLTASVTSTGTCDGGVTWSAAPTTGTLTAAGLTSTFSSSSPGTYTLTATSKDDATKSGSATVTVKSPCGTPNGTTVTHSSNITADETWAGDGVTHSVPGSIRIMAPATVTIQACAIVSLAPGVEITVVGDTTGNHPAKLVAAGTDDINGFITFVPATANQPWGFLHGVNAQSFIELSHTALQQAGAGGNFSLNAAIYMVGTGHYAIPGPVLKVDHLVIDHPVGAGVFMDNGSAFTSDSGPLGVVGATDHPIALEMMAVGSIPPFTGQNNAHDDALVIGPSENVFGDLTINANIPIRISSDVNVKDTSGTKPLGVTLTILPGAELRFDPVAKPRMVFGGAGNPGGNPIGRLIAVGTPVSPIRFTSAATAPGPGDWAGLQLLQADLSQMAFVIVEYAGGPGGYVSANCRPTNTSDNAALIIGGAAFVPPGSMLVSSIIQFSAGYGIDAVWANGSYDDPNLADSANGNVFNSNAGCNQTYNGLITGSCPTGGGCQPQ